jgi:cyclic pyranopterin phosphate synthase
MTLQDHHGRRFTYLRLSITDACNFRCNYCLPDGYQCSDSTPHLSVDEIRRTAMTFARLGTKKIRITGGEPALRRDLPDIIRAVASVPGIEEVALTTNGWKLPKLLPAWADAGLTRLNVSIDSLDPRQFQAITGHNRLQDLLGGLEVARQLGFTGIKVNAVLMREHNADQLPRFLEWIRETPVTLRFIELMQTGDNHEFFQQNHVRGEDIKAQLLADNWQPVLKNTTDGPAQEFWHPEYAGRIGLIMPYSKDFCQSCNRLRVSATGQLHLCLFGEQGFDLRPLLASDETLDAAADFVRHCLDDKKATHALHDGNTGVRTHFAGIGG